MRKRLIAIILGASVGVGAAGGLAGWAIYHTFVQSSRAYIFANWENYMSPQVQEYLADKYDIGFTNYGTNSDLIGLYVDGSYDVAVPSDYLIPQLSDKNALHQIDWSQFKDHGLTMLAPDQMPAYYDQDPQTGEWLGAYDNGANPRAVEENDPINLFNDIVKAQIVNFRGFDGARYNLLQYGVPYFMQDLVFAYRGPVVPELADETKSYTWKDILSAGSYFKDNLKVIDDERNVYSIGRSINTIEDDEPDSTINPVSSTQTDLDPAYRAFGNYADSMGSILWDTDSYGVLDYLARWEDGDARRGAILYNGDAVYAAQGGDVGAGDKNSTDFHVIHPQTTVFVMDMVTISSKTNPDKLPRLMEMVDELALSGMMVNADNEDYQSEDETVAWAPLFNADEDFIYANLSMQNFDNVNYVSVARDMDLTGSEYFSDSDEYEYFDDNDQSNTPHTIIEKNLFNSGTEKVPVYHKAGADGTDLGAVTDDDPEDGARLYEGTDPETGAVKYYAAYPTGNNAKVNTYTITVANIKSESIEAPFTDAQQTASLRYFYDLKQRLD